jgi:hypothetical protein
MSCDGEGHLYQRIGWHSPEFGGQWQEEEEVGRCPYCDGTGREIIEVEPIEMEDLP